MSSTKDKVLTYLLTPLSWIYNGVMEVRNKFFDWRILPSVEFDVPVISVGNIAVGGTGKTPHVEYLISRLSHDFTIGVVSRGYKRETKGFVLASPHSTPRTIGDEPYQIYKKFGRRIKLAVCESRRKGIAGLLKVYPEINLILLDDAFQHRYVTPAISILLTDYSRPLFEDKLLPLGRLRENTTALNRADVVVVTKCPYDMTPIEARLFSKKLDLMSFQHLYFSRIKYMELQPVFEEEARYSVNLDMLGGKDSVLLVSGVCRPRSIVTRLMKYSFRLRVSHFPDHHFFTRKDLEKISRQFEAMKGIRKIIVTTEKDAVRMADNPYFPAELKPFCFYLPIETEMWDSSSEEDFLNHLRGLIKGYRPGNA